MYNVFIYKGKEKGKKQTKKNGLHFFFVYVRFDEKTEKLERAAINFIIESIDVLMVTGARVLAVLDEETESPDPQRRRPPWPRRDADNKGRV